MAAVFNKGLNKLEVQYHSKTSRTRTLLKCYKSTESGFPLFALWQSCFWKQIIFPPNINTVSRPPFKVGVTAHAHFPLLETAVWAAKEKKIEEEKKASLPRVYS